MLTYSDKKEILKEAHYIIEHNATIRATATHCGTPKSTVHRNLTENLWYISPVLATKVRKILNKNMEERSIRGGMTTKEKYRLLAKK